MAATTSTFTVQVVCPKVMLPPLRETVPPPEPPVTVPDPQVVEMFAGFATTRLPGTVGSVSVKASPVWAGFPAPLVMVKVRVEDWPVSTAAGEKVLAMVVPTTVRLTAVAPVPAVGVWVVVTPFVVLELAPMFVLVTLRVTVQVPEAGRVSPVRVRAAWPLVKELPEAPPQVPPAVWAPETLMLVSVSVKVALESAMALVALFRVKVMVETPPGPMVAGEKALTIPGGFSATTEAVSPKAEVCPLLLVRVAAVFV